jgi:hypothetical protein
MHQIRKPCKNVLGGYVLGPTRYENRAKVYLVALCLPKVREIEVRLKVKLEIFDITSLCRTAQRFLPEYHPE